MHITKVKYFSDGSAVQCKNYKNFSNLCHHYSDSDLEEAWTFFAINHGKSAVNAGFNLTFKKWFVRKITVTLILNVTHHGWATKKIFNSRSYSNTSDLHLVPFMKKNCIKELCKQSFYNILY